jgi:hypothetical protein
MPTAQLRLVTDVQRCDQLCDKIAKLTTFQRRLKRCNKLGAFVARARRRLVVLQHGGKRAELVGRNIKRHGFESHIVQTIARVASIEIGEPATERVRRESRRNRHQHVANPAATARLVGRRRNSESIVVGHHRHRAGRPRQQTKPTTNATGRLVRRRRRDRQLASTAIVAMTIDSIDGITRRNVCLNGVNPLDGGDVRRRVEFKGAIWTHNVKYGWHTRFVNGHRRKAHRLHCNRWNATAFVVVFVKVSQFALLCQHNAT